jgi:diaminopimelate epimerase
VLDRNNIQIEIWERGAGYTLASGSSSSAAAAVAHKLGLCDRDISVHMPGGIIEIEIGDDYAIRMTGAVTKVADGVIAKEMFSASIAGGGSRPAEVIGSVYGIQPQRDVCRRG